MSDEPIFKQYFFVNTDIEMTKGKTLAQVSHITQVIVEEIIEAKYQSYPPPKYYFNYMKWKREPTVIVLKATKAELDELIKLPDSRLFIDNEIVTVVGFFPSSTMHDIASKYKKY